MTYYNWPSSSAHLSAFDVDIKMRKNNKFNIKPLKHYSFIIILYISTEHKLLLHCRVR